MRVHLLTVGRLRAGPEKALVDDYLKRFDRTGRGLGLTLGGTIEVEDRSKSGKAAEAALLQRALPSGAALAVLDERGRLLSSPDFATHLAGWRDTGRQDVALMIGGADGLDEALRREADLVLSLGPMVWPHMLARVMVAEQLYRASAILAGTPYHRV